jgi:rare lipoprotein A
MKRTSFRTASTATQRRAKKLGAGIVLLMGLALNASAKDGSPIATAPTLLPNDRSSPLANGSSIAASSPAVRTKHETTAKRWLQVGVASWYGSKFQGRKTAGGERFDMYGMTCAHRTLPLGTWLRVTNMRNHRTAFVRVNDRGPVLEGRIVDLSYAAAQSLGLVGVGKVRLETMQENDPELLPALVAQLQMPASLLALGK